jgi:hypothetical protein
MKPTLIEYHTGEEFLRQIDKLHDGYYHVIRYNVVYEEFFIVTRHPLSLRKILLHNLSGPAVYYNDAQRNQWYIHGVRWDEYVFCVCGCYTI